MASYEPLHDSSKWNELSKPEQVGRFALGYLLWTAFVALGILTASLFRQTYLVMLVLWGPTLPTAINRLDVVFVIFVVVVVLSYVLFMEHYLRRGVVTIRLRQRAVRALIWHVPITVVLFLAVQLLPTLLE